jgi:hypothetical protein
MVRLIELRQLEVSMSWFLAHAKAVPDDTIDGWRDALAERLGASVTPGRDDYLTRSRALGGWGAWVKDVPVAEDWSGAPLFRGVVVPIHTLELPSIGSVTEKLLRGFKGAGKPVLAWHTETGDLLSIDDVQGLGSESWSVAALLHLGAE